MSLTNLLKNFGIGVALVSSLSCGTEISCNEGRRYVEGKGCVDDIYCDPSLKDSCPNGYDCNVKIMGKVFCIK